ncbi:hypothetical protein ABPG74_003694 [Tetrahymena malaccensis]
MKQFGFLFPFLSGLFGSLAGTCGKITFQDEDYFAFANNYLNLSVRGAGLILVLFFNQLMMKFLLNSFQLNGATLTVLLSFIFNSASNCFVGYFIYNESISMRWGLGMLFIMIGVLLLSDKNKLEAKEEKSEKSEKDTKSKNANPSSTQNDKQKKEKENKKTQ